MMKAVRRWLANGATVLSLLLCVATAGAWVWSAQHPVSTLFEVNKIGPHGGSVAADGPGKWHFVSGQHEPISDWGIYIDVDRDGLDIRPFSSFYEWTIPWWRLILLWLIIPCLRIWPRRRAGTSTITEDRAQPRLNRWGWVLRQSAACSVSYSQEARTVVIAHFVSSYVLAAFYVIVIAVQNPGYFGYAGLRIVFSSLLAPITAPLFLLLILQQSDQLLGIETAFCAAYLIPLFAVYIWLTNRVINGKRRSVHKLAT
jgi:hypothetical protein